MDNEVIGKGYHKKAGTAHAEINAFSNAVALGNADKIKGCTLYSTLEPCHHQGPCDSAIVARKVKKVVIAVVDPDNRVGGQGVRFLRENGIEVEIGICVWEAEQSLRSYLYHRRTGIPFCIVKVALSLDAKIACGDGTSQWITGETARAHVHRELRAKSQAIIVGSGTAIADNPRLNVRGVADSVQPLRVVIDTRGRVTSGNLMDTSIGPTLVCTTTKASEESLAKWKEAGVEVKVLDSSDKGVNLTQLMQFLGKRGILQVLIEGGARIHSSFVAEKLCNLVGLYYGACFIGSTGKPWLQTSIAETIKHVGFMDLDKVEQLDNDVYLQYTASV